jgi:hypothetical protein
MSFFQNAQNTDARFSNFAFHFHTYCKCRQPRELATKRSGDGENIGHMVGPPDIDGWNNGTRPDGWKCLHSAGLITDDEWLIIQPLSLGILRRKLDGDCDEISRLPLNGHSVKTYMNHTLCYASWDKDAVTRTDHEPEKGSVILDNLNYFFTGLIRHQLTVYNLQIAYWYLMYQYMSHIPLRPGAEKAARESLNIYIMGESPHYQFHSVGLLACLLGVCIEGLRRRSESRAPFSLEESRKLLKWLETSDEDSANFVVLPPSGRHLSQSSAKSLVISYIMLNVGKCNNL